MQCGELRFGEFTLKSGRVSPYFYNSGVFDSGAKLARLAHFYAQAIVDSGHRFDMLFGPAYKGIPLAAAVAVVLAEQFGRDVPYCFNRKQAKDHGEGGTTVGAPLAGRVLIIDDVISAGTAVRESLEVINAAGATASGVVIALDRQERGTGDRGAIEELRERMGLAVIAVANLDAIARFLAGQSELQPHLKALERYRDAYGVKS